MSGGHFDHDPYRLDDIADSIERRLADTETPFRLQPEIVERFVITIAALRRTRRMVDRVDWLLSCDDGEESFLRRWKEEGLDD